MQTFLPLDGFADSAAVLDRARLGKQRIENFQIMQAIADPNYGWQNHPAVRMWRDTPDSLYNYQWAICTEWSDRNYRDSVWVKSTEFARKHWDLFFDHPNDYDMPVWMGDPDFHDSHKSNLIRKKPEHYGPLWPEIPDNLAYVWPVS